MAMTTRDSFALAFANIGIGTTAAKARTTTNVLHYTIDGRAYFKAATDDLWTPAGTALTTHQVCVFWLLLDSAGAATVSQSAIATAATAPSGYVAGAFGWPQFADKCVVGAILVKSGAAVFTPGTTALTTVATYFNAAGDYGKPITY